MTWLLMITLSAFAADVKLTSPSLSALVRLAEEHSPKIRSSRLNVEQAELEVRSSGAKFLPSLDLVATHGPVGKDPDPDRRPTQWTSSTALTLTETLYDNGANITKYQTAKKKLDRERKEYEYERDEHLLGLAKTYYDWSEAWQERQISDNKRDLLRRQYNILEAQYKQGLKTKRDVLRIETEVRRLQIDLLRKDNNIEVLLERLAAQTGVGREMFKVAGVSAEEAKLEAVVATGPWPEIKADEHRKKAILNLKGKEAELATRLVEREYWPRLTLTGEISNKYSNYVDTGNRFDHDPFWGWSTLLKLEYNLWDWGIRNRDLQISRLKERSVQAENEQNLRDLEIELHDVWLKLGEFAETVKMTKELLGIEQQSYNILEAEHRNGRATYLDLITNLNSLIDARSKYAASYFGLKRQQLIYAFHKGSIYEELKPK